MPESRYLWAEPALEEVAEGVYRCPLPLPGDPLRAVNAYLLRGADGLLLVDCGWDVPPSWSRLLEVLSQLGESASSVRGLFATHGHTDHLGAAARIRSESGAWAALGAGERDTLLTWASNPARARNASLERLRECAADDVAERLEREADADVEPWRPALPDLFLAGGELIRQGSAELEVIATPGHTRGHLCLYDRGRQLLFAGDLVLPQITPSLGVELPADDRPLASFLSSLERVRDLPVRLVLPSHGPVFAGLRDRVEELRQHHRLRLRACWEAVRAGAASPREVAGALTWTRRLRRFAELDGFNQMLAVWEARAHLQELVASHRLRSEVADSGLRYRLVRPSGGPAPGTGAGPPGGG